MVYKQGHDYKVKDSVDLEDHKGYLDPMGIMIKANGHKPMRCMAVDRVGNPVFARYPRPYGPSGFGWHWFDYLEEVTVGILSKYI